MRRLVPLFALVVPAVVSAQAFPLTVESIMRGPDVVGTAPSNVRFSADGRYVNFTCPTPAVARLDRDSRGTLAGASPAPDQLPALAGATTAMAAGPGSGDLAREAGSLKADLS